MRGVKEPLYKRPFDLFVLFTTVSLFFPLWVLLWTVIPLAIWLEDRGPVFFRQARYGKNGRVFELLKFRSMVVDAEKIGAGWTAARDPRVTRVGRILRRVGLDEIPQMINLLRGEISLVGPRALPVEMHEQALKLEPDFAERLRVRPGGTGLALIYGPRHCSPRKRLRYDLMYIEKAGFWLDLRILILTAWLTITGRWGTGFRMPEDDARKFRSNKDKKGAQCES